MFLFPVTMEEREPKGPGVPDMTMMPQITELAINDNLKRRYIHDLIYVSFTHNKFSFKLLQLRRKFFFILYFSF